MSILRGPVRVKQGREEAVAYSTDLVKHLDILGCVTTRDVDSGHLISYYLDIISGPKEFLEAVSGGIELLFDAALQFSVD